MINATTATDELLDRLSASHLEMLRQGSAISDAVILARGYRTITDATDLAALGFAHSQCRVPGLLLPLWTTDGRFGLHIYRPDNPRVVENKRKRLPDGTHPCKVIKYEAPKDSGTRLDCPPACQPLLADPSVPLWITEGQKKADALTSARLCAIALLGVWNWRGRNNVGGNVFLADWDYVALNGRQVRIVYDSDVMTKRPVQLALLRLIEHLQRKGALVQAVYLPGGATGKVGVDDWLAQGHNVAELEALAEAPRPAMPLPPPSFPNGLPNIDANEQDLRVVTSQAWEALKLANGPVRLVMHGGVPSRLEVGEDGGLTVRELIPDRLRHESARSANWYRQAEAGGTVTFSVSRPPMDVIRDMLALPNPPLPTLVRIVEAPVFAADGTLQTEPGYHAASRTYYAPAGGMAVPSVPTQPAATDIERARALIIGELLGEFPFVSDADRAHAVALLLLPFARDLIAGPTPNHLIEAPTAGSGKGLAGDVLLLPAVGRHVSLIAEARDDDEWRKRITSALREGRSAILIDNVARPLNSGVLAAALTAPVWTDRVLGKTELVSLPVRCVWATTANNPTMSTEIARRCVRIRLDPKVDRPWLREGFRYDDLRGWAADNRPQLVWAALALIQAWLTAGRPLAGTKPLGSYERWSAVMGGILRTAEIPGFLGNLAEFYEAADIEGAVWREFVAAWWEKFQSQEVGANDLFPLALGIDGFDLGKGQERSQRIVFGKALSKQRDRVIGDYRIVAVGQEHRLTRWRLLPTQGRCMSVYVGVYSHSFPRARENAFFVQHKNSSEQNSINTSCSGESGNIHQHTQTYTDTDNAEVF